MSRRAPRSGPWRGPECPSDPAHGPMVATTSGLWLCTHAAHDGRPRSHPAGAAPATRRLFRDEEVRPDVFAR